MSKSFIFGIGPAKSGTHSLAAALEMLGSKAVHFGHSGYWKLGHLETYAANKAAGRPLLSGMEEFDAFMDWPICFDWEMLRSQYPNSKYVLTYRDPHEAALSWVRMTSAQTEHFEDFDRTVARSYRHQLDAVTELYDSALKAFWGCSNFAVIATEDSDAQKWQQLCRLVGRPVPPDGTPYPRAFTREGGYQ